MDYRKFLSRPESHVLPYFGGARLDAPDRRLRIQGEAVPGWWEFEVEGRRAKPVKRAEPGDLSDRPAVRGHYACGWLFVSGREIERIALPPPDEPEPLAPCTGRRWYGGEVLFDSLEFEDEAEDRARRALEQGEPLEAKGVAPSLRAAFGFALAEAAGRAASVPISPREAIGHVHVIAEGGRAAAEALVARIEAERQRRDEERRRHEVISAAQRARPRDPAPESRDPPDRVDRALEAAGARMLRCRRRGDRQLEVAFSFMGERFISVVDSRTLQVYDAGICLSGMDEDLTLESLPAAIREAIETHQLCITRH